MDAEAAGELAHPLDPLLAPLGHDVGRPELLRERDPVAVTTTTPYVWSPPAVA